MCGYISFNPGKKIKSVNHEVLLESGCMYTCTHSELRHWMEFSRQIHAPVALSSGNAFGYLIIMGLYGLQNRSGRFLRRGILLSVSWIELQFLCRPVRVLVIIYHMYFYKF